MINFIICDDEEIFRESLKEKIDSCMMQTTIEYKTCFFDCYDRKFKDFTENINQFNVYFLDIITPHGTGMDAARYIRDKAGDWNSIIIFVTNYNEYRFKVLSSRLGVFDFIRKSPKALSRISDIIFIVISRYNTTSTKCITFEKDHSIFKIKYKDIIYIERELNSKSCILFSTAGEFRITKSLSEIEAVLDGRFFRSHRSAIVNIDNIQEYNIRTNVITFYNGERTDLISRNKKKELKQRVINSSQMHK